MKGLSKTNPIITWYHQTMLLLLLHLLFFTLLVQSSFFYDHKEDSDFHFINSFESCLQHKTHPSDKISATVFDRANASYPSLLRDYIRNARFNTSSAPKPLLILTPLRKNHVQAAVVCSRYFGIQLKVRGGGHDYEGISYVSDVPFILLDLFNLRSVVVDIEDESAWVEAGATLGEVYYKIWEKSKVHGFPAGVCPTVGVGGHIGGGGYGNMLRKYGLASDQLLDVKIVNIKGQILDRESMSKDLFWAMQGGGAASFGVVLAYKIRLVPVPATVTVFRLQRTLEQNATDIVHKWQHIAPTIDNNLFMRMLLQPVVRTGNDMSIRASIVTLFLGNAEELVSLLNKKFPELGLTKESCLEMSWIESVLWWGNFANGTNPKVLLDRNLNSATFLRRKSDYVERPISKKGLEKIWKRMIEIGRRMGMAWNPYGGRMSEIASSASAFPHRSGNLFKIQYSVNWEEVGEEADKRFNDQIRKLHNFMTPFVSKNPRRAFLNYRDLDIGINDNGERRYEQGKVYGVKYFHGNFDRLVKVKSEVDSENFFWNEQSIPPFPYQE